MSEKSKKDAKNNGSDSKLKGFFAKVGKFLREYRSELKKISWPTFAEVVKNTVITMAAVVIIGALIWLVDWGIGSLRNALIESVKEDTAQVQEFEDYLASSTDTTSIADVIDAVVTNTDAVVDAVDDALAEADGQ